jgi:ligand-binding sensor domain-containing protein
VSNWPRFFRAGICAVYGVLIGGLAQPARALDGGDKNLSANLWLTRTWQTDEGLPDNNVTGVAQTSDGHLWVATVGGLMRFDGERFEKISTAQLPKAPNRVVRTIYLVCFILILKSLQFTNARRIRAVIRQAVSTILMSAACP